MPATRPRSPAWTAPVAALVVFVGLAVVALASRGGPGGATGAAYDAPNLDRYLFGGFLVAVVVATGLVIWVMWPDGRAGVATARTSWWRRYALSLAVLFLLVGVGALRDRLEPHDARDRSAEEGDPPTPDDGSTGSRSSGTATVALAAVMGAAIGAAALVRLARRRVVPVPDAGDQTAAFDPARADVGQDGLSLPEGLDEADIAAEADPRRAVLLSYALLEQRLSETPIARQASTSPQEWLRHVTRWGVPDLVPPFRILTVLYERARFSVRPVTPADQATAVGALRQALDQASTSTAGAGAG